MNNYFLWDSSGDTILCSTNGNTDFSLFHRVEKKMFMKEIPPLFFKVFEQYDITDTAVYIGAGPGSFTGIKSGVSFVGGWLFSKELYHINLVSSSDILSCYIQPSLDLLLTLTPFNRNEWFASLYVWNGDYYKSSEKDVHLLSESQLNDFIEKIDNKTLFCVTQSKEIQTRAKDILHQEYIRWLLPRSVPYRHPAESEVIKSIDIRKDPLFLQYILQPANLKDDVSLYVKTDL